MGFPVSEAYSLPTNAKFLVVSVKANLCEKTSDAIRILLENVQFTISRDATVRTTFGYSVKREVLASGVASDPEANQGMEDRS